MYRKYPRKKYEDIPTDEDTCRCKVCKTNLKYIGIKTRDIKHPPFKLRGCYGKIEYLYRCRKCNKVRKPGRAQWD